MVAKLKLMKQVYRFLTLALILSCLQSSVLGDEPWLRPIEPDIYLHAERTITCAKIPPELLPVTAFQTVKTWYPPRNARFENGARIFRHKDTIQYQKLPKSGRPGALIRICLLRPPGVGPLKNAAWQYEQWTEGVDLIRDHFEDLSLLQMPPMPRSVGTFRTRNTQLRPPDGEGLQSPGPATITDRLFVELENPDTVSVSGRIRARWRYSIPDNPLRSLFASSETEQIILAPGEIRSISLSLPSSWAELKPPVQHGDLIGMPLWIKSKIGNQDQGDSGAPGGPPMPGF